MLKKIRTIRIEKKNIRKPEVSYASIICLAFNIEKRLKKEKLLRNLRVFKRLCF